MSEAALKAAIACVPAGRWGVAVSGGADSVALLRLLLERNDLSLLVIHLDHETREGQSGADAAFVAHLARAHGLPLVAARRSEIEPALSSPPGNRSARFRACRHELFARAVRVHHLHGVLLGHHADDQAETVLHRLLRGSGAAGLAGMSDAASVRGIVIRRPLLSIRSDALHSHLRCIDQPWCEDASNTSPAYTRNRLRALLRHHAALIDPLLCLADSMQALRAWTQANTPRLPAQFGREDLDGYPSILQRQALRGWLVRAGCPPDDIDPATLDRLDTMLRDAATPRRAHFPGQVLVTRKHGKLSA